MKRKLWVIPLTVILLTVIFWFTNQFIYPVIPPNIGNQIVIGAGILVALVSFLSNIATILDYFEKNSTEHSLSTDNNRIRGLSFTQLELDIYNKLCTLNRSDFEDVVYKLRIEYTQLPDYGSSQSIRAEALLSLAYNNITSIESISKIIHEIERKNGFIFLLGESFLVAFSVLLKGLYNQLISWGLIQQPAETQIINEYLKFFEKEMARRNGGDLVYVQQYAGNVADTAIATGDFSIDVPRGEIIKRVRHVLRLLTGVSRGGDNASAQLASVNRPSRVVKDAVKILTNSKEPLILLGDPGSGKSMTIREAGRQIANKNYGVRYPKVVIYVPLSIYVSKGVDDHPGSVLDLIYQSIPLVHKKVGDLLPKLIADHRLIILFDGMDEMEHSQYGNRIRELSRFARTYSGELKALFACRINDFVPEFEHRQMVLLPFEKTQITEFVEKNIQFPIKVNGKDYNKKIFIKHLMEKYAVGETASNPLILFLICHYVKWNGKWPDRRADLFMSYINAVYNNYAKKINAPLDEKRKENTVFGLSFLAYSIASIYNGTYGKISELQDKFGSKLARKIFTDGQKCGLLLPVPEDPDGARFSHHRLQEFLTAYYIEKSGIQIQWDKLLDIPRWQETLINLVSLNPTSKSIQALHESLITRIPKELDLETENQLADRLVLASNILKELGRDKELLPFDLESDLFDLTKKLSKQGRPTTQIKVLWAWKNTENLPVEILLPQLRSEISWVREQAIMVVGALSSSASRTGSNIVFEIGTDLAKGNLIRRLPVYLKLLFRNGVWHWFIPLIWATLISLIYYLSVVTTSISLLILTLSKFPVSITTPTNLIIIDISLMLVLTSFLGTRKINIWQGFLLSSIAISILAVYVRSLGKLDIIFQTFDAFSMVPYLAGLVIINHVTFWLSYYAYALPACVANKENFDLNLGTRFAADSEINKLYQQIETNPYVIGLFIMWAFGYISSIPLVSKIMGWVFPLVLLISIISWLVSIFTEKKHLLEIIKDIASYCLFYPIVYGIGGVAIVFVAIFFSNETVKTVVFQIVLGILITGFVILLLFLVSRLIRNLIYIRIRKYSSNEWQETIKDSDPQTQYIYLTRTGQQNLAVSTKEYLKILISLEGTITEDPAASAYWELRHKLEETVRRESSDSSMIEDTTVE